MTKHKLADELPDIGRDLIISDEDSAMLAVRQDDYQGETVWHLRPLRYASVPIPPKYWQYYDIATGEVS
jgi:hypothetical protein